MHIFSESEADEEEEGVSVELLLLRVSEVSGGWEEDILHALEVLPDIEEFGPFLGNNSLQTLLE